MPNLDALLSDGTMLRKANPMRLPLPDVLPSPVPNDEKNVKKKSIWHFRHDPNLLDQISNLTCWVNDMSMTMTVCDLVKWGPVAVTFKGNSLELPLTKQFYLFSEYIKEGRIPGSNSGLWQLDAFVDQSFQHIFAFEFPQTGKSSSILPVKTEITQSEKFMPDSSEGSKGISGRTGETTIVGIPPLRIVVVISLVCCKEREDFDPGGMLGGARIYPLTMVMANQHLERITSQTKVMRPGKTPHTRMKTRSTEVLTGSVEDEMLPELGSILFTDNNNPPSKISNPPPHWPQIFAYYDVNPNPGKVTAVYPIISAMKLPSGDMSDTDRTISAGIKGRDIKKLPGQGEFDNCHIAPKMIDRAANAAAPGRGFDKITMAPFCAHDCLHTHWRWSNESTGKSNLGWDGFSPYQKAGAPMVPPNQKVTFELLPSVSPGMPPHSFEYTAEADQIVPGSWQVIFHHGSAYAVSVTNAAMMVMHLFQAPPVATGGQAMRENFALFYWNLRFGMVGILAPKPEERIQIVDLKKLREG